jgi:hypothetical protein
MNIIAWRAEAATKKVAEQKSIAKVESPAHNVYVKSTGTMNI